MVMGEVYIFGKAIVLNLSFHKFECSTVVHLDNIQVGALKSFLVLLCIHQATLIFSLKIEKHSCQSLDPSSKDMPTLS